MTSKANTPKTVKATAPNANPQEKVDEVVVNMEHPDCEAEGIRLNIGSGTDIKEDYLNVDRYAQKADANWDMRELPLNDDSVAQIICYQTLEHISQNDVFPTLKEWYRVLKPRGNVIITVPDIVSICQQVVDNPEDDWVLARVYGTQAHDGQFHKSGFTPKKIGNMLGRAGFTSTKVAYFEKDGHRHIYVESVK